MGGYTDADGSARIFLLRLRERDLSTIDLPAGEIGLDNGGLNSRGEIVGVYCDTAPCRSANADAHGFLLGGGHFDRLDFPGAISTNAFGINSSADIVGVYENATGVHGFLLTRRE